MADGGKVYIPTGDASHFDFYLLTASVIQYTCGLPRIQQTKGKKCVVYSFGVERESSWEAEILERTDCEIFMYDYSVDKVSDLPSITAIA